MAAGGRIRYEPSAIVYHPVAEARLRKEYFLDWWFDRGRAEAREFGRPAGRALTQIPVRLLGSLALWTVKWAVGFRSNARFYRKLVVWQKTGQILELRRLARANR